MCNADAGNCTLITRDCHMEEGGYIKSEPHKLLHCMQLEYRLGVAFFVVDLRGI